MSFEKVRDLKPGNFIDYSNLGKFIDQHKDFEEEEELYSDNCIWLVRWKYKDETIAIIHYEEGSDPMVRESDTEVLG